MGVSVMVQRWVEKKDYEPEEVVAAAAAAGWHVVSVYLQNSFLTLGRLFLDLRIPGRARNWVFSPQTPTRFLKKKTNSISNLALTNR